MGQKVPEGPPSSVALSSTVSAAAVRTAGERSTPGGGAGRPTTMLVEVGEADIREQVRVEKLANLVIVAVDASGSMGAARRMEAAKGAVLALLLDAYQHRDRVAMVAFRGERAEVLLRPTGSVEVARARLEELPTGGRTPLAAGIRLSLDLASQARKGPYRPVVVLVSDGRATHADGGGDPLEEAAAAAGELSRAGVPAVVVDAEEGPVRLGLARVLAEAMGAKVLEVDDLAGGALKSLLRIG